MKTKVVVTYETENIDDSTDILTQIGVLVIKNSDKISSFEIDHMQDVKEK